MDGVEAGDRQLEAVDPQEPAARHAEAVRAVLAALGEDPDARPVGVAARVTGAPLDRRLRDEVEQEDDLEVRELVQPGDGVRPEPVAVEAE